MKWMCLAVPATVGRRVIIGDVAIIGSRHVTFGRCYVKELVLDDIPQTLKDGVIGGSHATIVSGHVILGGQRVTINRWYIKELSLEGTPHT